jgi:protein gp37
MSTNTKIEWTDASWNPIRGCTRVSEGCRNCYAERQARRLAGKGMPYEELVNLKTGVWTGKVVFAKDKLEDPLRWKKPRRIFVNSMSDLFHESIPFCWIADIFTVMAQCPQHVFQVLTKRPEVMQKTMSLPIWFDVWNSLAQKVSVPVKYNPSLGILPNVWLGVSVENQQTADERIPLLLETPAAVRWISAEPLLGLVEIPYFLRTVSTAYACFPPLDWVVAGGESGPHARPMHPDWARALCDQCVAAGVPFFFKQWGHYRPYDAGPGMFKECAIDIGSGVSDCTRTWMVPVGKKSAGRLLDGREWNEYPR